MGREHVKCWRRWKVFVCLFVLCLKSNVSSSVRLVKECAGGEPDLSTSYTTMQRYEWLKKMYENCTHVTNSLFITDLSGSLDMTFLKDIRVVAGSVIIFNNSVAVIPLTSLVVIRGYNPAYPPQHGVGLHVAMNSDQASGGLQELQLISLEEILNGDVIFTNNKQMCYDSNINWEYILNREDAKFTLSNDNKYQKPKRCKGKNCDESCITSGGESHCWGEGPTMCQKLNSLNCHESCSSRGLRCYGPGERDCCVNECAGGCTGNTRQDCLACRNLEDNGACVDQCPPRNIYDRRTFSLMPNPNFKYQYGLQCLATCGTMKILQDFCVSKCPFGYSDLEDGYNCKRCAGTCPTTIKWCTAPETHVFANNIEIFRNCTHVHGSIKIHNISFSRFSPTNTRALTLDQLHVFENVEEITDYLLIDAYIENMTSLSFFKMLKVISGQKLLSNEFALSVVGTCIEYLGLSSLQQINQGNVTITNNKNLCYADDSDYQNVFQPHTNQSIFTTKNAEKEFCITNNRTCSDQCGSKRCWGPGDDMCWTCKNVNFEGRCLETCNTSQFNISLFNKVSAYGAEICKRCHEECSEGCNGDGPGSCLGECKHFWDQYQDECVEKCPLNTFPDHRNVCHACYPDCSGGCTGARAYPGKGGCNKCHQLASFRADENSLICLPEETSNCPFPAYLTLESFDAIKNISRIIQRDTLIAVCRECHPECLSCRGDGDDKCDRNACVNYAQESRCVKRCSDGFYNNDISNKTCHKCNTQDQHENCVQASRKALSESSFAKPLSANVLESPSYEEIGMIYELADRGSTISSHSYDYPSRRSLKTSVAPLPPVRNMAAKQMDPKWSCAKKPSNEDANNRNQIDTGEYLTPNNSIPTNKQERLDEFGYLLLSEDHGQSSNKTLHSSVNIEKDYEPINEKNNGYEHPLRQNFSDNPRHIKEEFEGHLPSPTFVLDNPEKLEDVIQPSTTDKSNHYQPIIFKADEDYEKPISEQQDQARYVPLIKTIDHELH